MYTVHTISSSTLLSMCILTHRSVMNNRNARQFAILFFSWDICWGTGCLFVPAFLPVNVCAEALPLNMTDCREGPWGGNQAYMRRQGEGPHHGITDLLREVYRVLALSLFHWRKYERTFVNQELNKTDSAWSWTSQLPEMRSIHLFNSLPHGSLGNKGSTCYTVNIVLC